MKRVLILLLAFILLAIQANAQPIIKLDPSGDDQYNLVFETREGKVYRIPYVSNEGGTFKYGEEDNDLVFVEGKISNLNSGSSEDVFNIGFDDWFVLSDSSTKLTYIVRFDSIDAANNQLRLIDIAGGNRQFTYTSSIGFGGVAKLTFGKSTHLALINEEQNEMAVDMNADGKIDGSEIAVYSAGNVVLDIGQSIYSGNGLIIKEQSVELVLNEDSGSKIEYFKIITRPANELGISLDNIKPKATFSQQHYTWSFGEIFYDLYDPSEAGQDSETLTIKLDYIEQEESDDGPWCQKTELFELGEEKEIFGHKVKTLEFQDKETRISVDEEGTWLEKKETEIIKIKGIYVKFVNYDNLGRPEYCFSEKEPKEGYNEPREERIYTPIGECIMDYIPVCGIDGQTYRNKCFASVDNIKINYEGECKEDSQEKICTLEYNPICGVNGKTYSNSCFAELEKVKVAYNGECKSTIPVPTPIEECSNGCFVEDRCLPIGTRISNGEATYCSYDGSMKIQLEEGEACQNHYECSSNICASGQCLSKSFIQKLTDWLKKLFGA